ncbi:class C sortase [Corynebacterium sp. 13CS0277]|uniref:class C sortase n=1 Tax=Corynebacterium sp. 13CS0277 TaxID=2071994 RepID=UPI000D029D31|nr:class C sortase [Corynebacterium sp. 13CS0277]PRQ11661.1 class C sortase [Corynebacterium sp. 13CS0277]
MAGAAAAGAAQRPPAAAAVAPAPKVQPEIEASVAAAEKQAEDKGKRNVFTTTILPLVLVLLGVLVLSYPMVAMQWNNYRQAKIAEQYASIIQDQPQAKVYEGLEHAEEYNRQHSNGPTYDPWTGGVDLKSPEYQEYLSQLALVDTMSQIVIPSIGVNLPVKHGTESDTLDSAIGHLFGSSLPVGGESTHSVLTGHTGLTNSTLFDNLTAVKEGDAFYLNTYGRKMKYLVDEIQVVLPDKTDKLGIQEGRDLVTLITCTPYGINSHRLLVTGHRVPMDPEEETRAFTKNNTIVWTWWMILTVVAVVLILLVMLILGARAIYRRMKKN